MQAHPAADKNSTSLYNAQNMVTAAIEKSRHVREPDEGLRFASPPRPSAADVYPDDHSDSTAIGMVKKPFDSQGGNRGRRRISMINGFRLAGNQWAASGRDPIPLSDAFAVMISVSPVASVAAPTVHKSAQSGQSVDRFVSPFPISGIRKLRLGSCCYGVSTTPGSTGTPGQQINEYFVGSTFDSSGNQTADGTQYNWTILYQGENQDALPGVYETANGAFNPRQQSLLAPDLSVIQAGIVANAYDPGSTLSYLGSAIASAWNSVYESTPLYGAGQALMDIGNGISELSSWANNEINSAPTWLQPVLAPYQVELGAFNSVGNMIGGMGSLLENPISTAANVALHPVDAAEAAWGGVTGTFSNLLSGNPYQTGQAVGNIAMAVAPLAGEFGDVARVGEAGGEVIPRTVSLNVLNPEFTPTAAESGTAVSTQQYVEITANGERIPGYGPKVPYNRIAAYGNTPSDADRALGLTDHQPPLVQRYYEGDAAANELPGFLQSDAERAASAADQSRLVAPAQDFHSQGGWLRQYSLQMRKYYFGY